MKKKCTNSACRKSFSVDSDKVFCPWCGKAYPRLNRAERTWIHSLKLSDYGSNKIAVIKATRLLTGLHLIEGKVLVERTENEPISIEIKKKENITKAEELLRKAGANYSFSSKRVRS